MRREEFPPLLRARTCRAKPTICSGVEEQSCRNPRGCFRCGSVAFSLMEILSAHSEPRKLFSAHDNGRDPVFLFQGSVPNSSLLATYKWEFPKIRGTLFVGSL